MASFLVQSGIMEDEKLAFRAEMSWLQQITGISRFQEVGNDDIK